MSSTATIDTSAMQRRVGAALQRAAERSVLAAAMRARDDIKEALRSRLDRPVPFTLMAKGYLVHGPQRGQPDPTAEMIIKDRQARYLQYVFDVSSERRLGDPGTSARHIWIPTPSLKTTVAGGVPKTASKRLMSLVKATRREGAAAKSARKRAARAGQQFDRSSLQVSRLAKSQYARTLREWGDSTGGAESSRGTGVWYGRIAGATGSWGFWLRPKRTGALRKFDRLSRRWILMRPSDPSKKVRNKGAPVLLLKSKRMTKHHQIIAREAIMSAAQEYGNEGFNRRLQEELSRLT